MEAMGQVPIIGFNSGEYGFNMVQKYFVKETRFNKGLDYSKDILAAKKENNFMILTTYKFQFSHVQNYLLTLVRL